MPERALSRRAGAVLGTIVLAFALAGCSGLVETSATPAPVAFPDIADALTHAGITVTNWVSGDAGCSDSSLTPTAIRFDAQGLDQPQRVQLRIYIFADRAAWERRAPDVDACVATWATDPATFELLEVSPYVLAGQGPWGPGFKAAVDGALVASAGSGG
jgi:hypothetical protein